MSKESPKNIHASVHQRLLNWARERDQSYDQILQYFAIERFLYRLSKTRWGDCFIVKGAIMLRAWGTPLGRPTRDIDFLGEIENSTQAVEEAVRECLAVEAPEDGLQFDEAIETEEINVEDRYPGVRVVIRGELDGARFRLQLDVGIDDAVVPDPAWVDYPTLLDLEAPRVLAYQPETALAEKFETIANKGVANSRLRDYYDIWLLSTLHAFDGRPLAGAITATFHHRETAIPTDTPAGLTEAFYMNPDSLARWKSFLVSKRVDAPESLEEVCGAIARFLMPPSVAAAVGNDFAEQWDPQSGWS